MGGARTTGRDEVLKAINRPTNRSIMNYLRVESSYPRQIAAALHLPESEVSRSLKGLERLGLVQSSWSHIGKNVKLYSLLMDHLTVRVMPDGLEYDIVARDGTRQAGSVEAALDLEIPQPVDFVGRQEEMSVLAGPEPVVLIVGMPGIGKTSLLARYARHQTAGTLVFWHSFNGFESLNWFANHLAVFLSRAGRDDLREAWNATSEPAARQGLVLAALDTEHLVTILDDVHAIQDEGVRRLVEAAVGRVRRGKLVVASRLRLPHNPSDPAVRLMRLGGLDDGAVRRLAAEKGVPFKARLLPAIREEVGGHPLALILFLEAVKELGVPVQQLLDRVPERNLEEYLLEEVYQKLGEDERHVLSLGSLFPGRFGETDLAAVATRPVQSGILALRRRLLLQVFDTGYSLHEIIRNFFYNLLQDKPRLHKRLAEHYLKQGSLEGRLAALHHLVAAGERDRVLRLLQQNLDLPEFDLLDAGYHELYLRTLEIFTPDNVADDRTWALILDEKGDIHLHRGDDALALGFYTEALRVLRRVKDPTRRADLSWKRALALEGLGRLKDALEVCRTSLKEDEPDGPARKRLVELSRRLKRPARAKGAAPPRRPSKGAP